MAESQYAAALSGKRPFKRVNKFVPTQDYPGRPENRKKINSCQKFCEKENKF
jgi:hypothetical protein